MEIIDDKLIVLTTYSSAVNAQIAKSVLDDSEIPSYLFDENMANLTPFHSGFIGGIRLMVPESLVPAAASILGITSSLKKEVELEIPQVKASGTVCPKCCSTNIRTDWAWIGLLILSFIFSSQPLAKSKRMNCKECGDRWYESY